MPSTMIAPDVGLLSFPAAILIMDAFSVPDADPARNDECPVRHRRRVRGVCHPRDSSDVGASVHEQITAYSCSAVDDERPGSAACAFYVSGCVQPSVKIDVPRGVNVPEHLPPVTTSEPVV
jgi:hypothetical protein